MDQALKNTLGWTLCAILIILAIFGYNHYNNRELSKNNNDLWIETQAEIIRIDSIRNGPTIHKYSYIVNYSDSIGNNYQNTLISSKFIKTANNKITVFYNTNNPNKIIGEKAD